MRGPTICIFGKAWTDWEALVSSPLCVDLRRLRAFQLNQLVHVISQIGDTDFSGRSGLAHRANAQSHDLLLIGKDVLYRGPAL